VSWKGRDTAQVTSEVAVPTGKVRFYDSAKGFGFLSKEEGGDVYVRANALPPGVTTLKPGQRVEFGVVEGRKGEQALSLRLIEAPPSLAQQRRKSPDEMAAMATGADAILMPGSARRSPACCVVSPTNWTSEPYQDQSAWDTNRRGVALGSGEHGTTDRHDVSATDPTDGRD
jgi:cold shock CspA family protein